MSKYKNAYEEGRYSEAIENIGAQSLLSAEDYLFGTLSALAVRDNFLAETLIEKGLVISSDKVHAELLALRGATAARRGNFSSYRSMSERATSLHVTPLTLYHLGLSLPPEDGKTVLREMLHLSEELNDAHYISLASYALAINLKRRGKYRQAYSHACLASITKDDQYKTALRFNLKMLADDSEKLESEVAAFLCKYKGLQLIPFQAILADVYYLEGEAKRALKIYEDIVARISPRRLPYYGLGLIRMLCALGKRSRAEVVAQAICSFSDGSTLHYALGELAVGMALLPSIDAEEHLRNAYQTLDKEWSYLAAQSAFYLASCLAHNGMQDGATTIMNESRVHWQELSETGRRLLSGEAHEVTLLAIPDYQLFVLGDCLLRFRGQRVKVRPKGILIMTLLLQKQQRYDLQTLSEELACANTNAIKVELSRLRKVFCDGLTKAPYCLSVPIWADFLEMKHLLWQQQYREALELYRGELLPGVDVPIIDELRRAVESDLLSTIINCKDLETTFILAQKFPDDLESWERLISLMPNSDPRFNVVRGRVKRLKAEYNTLSA